MKKLVAMLVLAAGLSAFATPVNITVVGPQDTAGWPSGGYTNVPPGDNEVMPGNLHGNNWDMEAVLLDGNSLSLVGSYDWANGYDGTKAGDLFIAVDGSPTYDYALRFDYTTSQYDVYQISSTTKFVKVYENSNSASNPFMVDALTASDIGTYGFTYQTGLADNAALGYTTWLGTGDGITNAKHDEITVDLGDFISLKTGDLIASHITMSCGNDELVGFGKVPEPGSLSMILVGLLSIVGLAISRKRK
jgi:hypothetical protein